MSFTFTAYQTPNVIFVMVYIYYLHKDHLADDEPAQIYGSEPSDDEFPEMHEFV